MSCSVEPTAVHRRLGGALELVVLGRALRRYPLPAEGELVLGRAAACAICIDEPTVSRRHAALAIGPAGAAIRDLGSACGTRIGPAAIGAAPVAIAPDALIALGDAAIVLRRVEPAAAPGPAGLGPAMARVHALIERVAVGTISVLLLGETGVGKEVLAEALHRRSARAAQPLVRLNCAALSEGLLESELFGHEKGAFTGADRAKPGLLEIAHGGTVFLDEIGELPPAAQVKLLRVLERRELTRVGGLAPRPVDVRFVAATHRDLRAEIAAGRFRQDLYYRLDGVAIAIPPLRERRDELDELARVLVARAAAGLGVPAPAITAAARARLHAHTWPGNIRELRNALERAVLLAGGAAIDAEHLVLEPADAGAPVDAAAAAAPVAVGPARDADRERARIVAALAQAAGNQKVAAALLGVSRRTLSNKLDAHAIARPRKRAAAAP